MAAITYKQAKAFRRVIEKYSGEASDEEVIEVPFVLPAWQAAGVQYTAGERVQYEGKPYKCVQTHTSQADWTPEAAASLWSEILIPDPEVIPDWVQPGSTNPYKKGDKVRHVGKVWESMIDNNVWEPGAVGTENLWAEVTEAAAE